MQTYELLKIQNLPDIIPVNYRYINDRRPEANIPENFRIDFPDYVWHRFGRLKKLLNDKKQELDKYVDTPEKSRQFTFITMHSKSMMSLKKNKLLTEYNSEIKSNAFLKLYEILRWMKDMNAIPLCGSEKLDQTSSKNYEKIEKIEKIEDLKKFRKTAPQNYKTLSIAEAPGNFILALNHFIKTECPNLIWDWRASTFKTVNDESYYLSDTYGIIKRFPENWIYGIDGDGDITSTNNLESFDFVDHADNFSGIKEAKILKRYDLLTSDVKYVPQDNIYSEEESINLPVMTGHTLAALFNLNKNGSAVLKEFSLFECGTISLLYLLSYAFKKVFITKPTTSKQANSEVYVVCIGFLDNLNFGQKTQLKTYLNWIRFLNKPKKDMVLPALFREVDFNDEWFLDLVKINKDLTERQIKELDEMIEIVDKYQNNKHLSAQNDFRLTNERLEDKWIAENQIKRLRDEDKMLTQTTGSGDSRNSRNSRFGISRNTCDCDKESLCVHKNQIRAILNTKSEYFRKLFLEILGKYLAPEKIEEFLVIYRQKSDTELYDFITANSSGVDNKVQSKEDTISPEKLIKFNQSGDLDSLLPADFEETKVKFERFYLNDKRLKDLVFHLLGMGKIVILRDVDVDVVKTKNSQLLFDIINILKNYKNEDLRPIYKTYHYPRRNTEKLIEKIATSYEARVKNMEEISVKYKNNRQNFNIMLSKK